MKAPVQLTTLSVVALLLGGCVTTATQDQLAQAYPGERQPAAKTAVIVTDIQRNGWAVRIETVDGVPAPFGARILPGTHTIIAHTEDNGVFIEEATVQQNGQAGIDMNRLQEVRARHSARTRKTLTLEAVAGSSYVVRCDPETGGNLRVESGRAGRAGQF